ncbi:hypothetical protein [Pseudorhodobacter sp. E13]|uniref:hypothetical protein n=1 Tax=Pseudorhodobacter sp. E13 TaxID=2487931 RepID=UPI001315263E|nr:hypothetical protein [Pseudorhodobacter sp. E13]
MRAPLSSWPKYLRRRHPTPPRAQPLGVETGRYPSETIPQSHGSTGQIPLCAPAGWAALWRRLSGFSVLSTRFAACPR